MASKFTELAIDCADPNGLARFWCSVLDYEVQDEDDGIVTIGSPMVPEGKNHLGPVPPTLTFAHVPEREGMTVVGVVADTKSGTVAPWDRKNLKPWVTEPEKMAMYDAVVAYKTDRWSRGTQEDFTRIEFWATQNGKRLIIVDGPQYPARADRFDSDYWQWQAEKMAPRAGNGNWAASASCGPPTRCAGRTSSSGASRGDT
jgi:hypothetical protein